jgi:aubergine-like protein
LTHLKDLNRKGYVNDRINEEFKGMTVVTSYSKAGKHTYKIERVDFDKTPQDGFEKKDGSKITYIEYFSSQYQTEIKDMN